MVQACQNSPSRTQALFPKVTLFLLVCVLFSCRSSEIKPQTTRKKLDQSDIELLYKQADLVVEVLKKYNSEVIELSENEYKARIRSEAFAFLLNREASDFPDLFKIAYGPFTDELVPECIHGVFWDEDASARHYYLWTNFWKRFPILGLSDAACTDEYVISVVDGKVVAVKGRATLPY